MTTFNSIQDVSDAMARRDTFNLTVFGKDMTEVFKLAFVNNYRFYPIDNNAGYDKEEVDVAFLPN